MVTLRGLVYDRFRSISEFADAIGWSCSKASRIVNGEQQLTRTEIERVIEVLDIPQEDVAPIFFGRVFTE